MDGEFTRVLEPGLHAFWKFQRALKSAFVDRRVQAMEVQGQEILTRDKVREFTRSCSSRCALRSEPAHSMSCSATRARSIARSGRPWRRGSVTEKIDKLTVYGGLEGVLKDVVRIAQPEA